MGLLSGGQPTLAVAMGYHEAYRRQFGINGRWRMSRFEASLEALRAVQLRRSGFSLDDVLCKPPAQPAARAVDRPRVLPHGRDVHPHPRVHALLAAL